MQSISTLPLTTVSVLKQRLDVINAFLIVSPKSEFIVVSKVACNVRSPREIGNLLIVMALSIFV